jgi:DNA-binding CsgD family transcriptional regulator
MGPELFGRDAELAGVVAFLDAVPSGPVGLLIEGEPGIGKTTLWHEVVRQAEERGFRVLRARPAEREQSLSYAALGDLLRGVIPDVEATLPEPQIDALRSAMLLSESNVAIDPRTTATGLVTALSILAARVPLVVAIDDAQWLDSASERALEFATRRLPGSSGLALARRSGIASDPLRLVGSIGRDAVIELRLGPLAPEALKRVVAARGSSLSTSAARLVARGAGGNPFVALELARTLDGVDPAPGDPLPIPPVLFDLVRDRVGRLSPGARHVAVVVAALSRPDRASVGTVLGSGDEVDAAIVEAEEAQVLSWDGERLRFAHPLLASAVYGSLSTGRRRALHRRLAEASTEPEDRAYHLVRSVVGANEAAAAEIESGAEVAERRGAVDAAAELFVSAYRRTVASDGDGRARRAIGAARALSTAGDLPAAKRLAEEALAATVNGSLRAQALVILGSLASYIGTIEQRVAAHEAALEEVAGDPTSRARILVELGERVTIDPWRAAQESREATDLLRRASDEKGLARALMHQVMASAVLGLGAPREALDEMRTLEAGTPDRRMNSLIWFHWMDDLGATRQRFELQVRLAGEDGDVLAVAELAEFMAMIEFRTGDWAGAERRLEEACAHLGELDLRGPLVATFADRSVVDAHRGRVERARDTLRKALDQDLPLDRFWIAVCLSALGSVEFTAGDLPAADRAWTAMRQASLSVGWLEFPEDRSEPDHVETLLLLGDRQRALEVLARLEWRGRTLPRPWIDATLPRARALVTAADGNVEGGIALLEAASDVAAFPFEHARLLMTRGQLERRANRRLAARRSLEAALEIFERLGSPPWIDRARQDIGRLGLRHGGRHQLTAMERRVAELAATGLTNRQVASAAFVSPKTVEANLARVYGKLGIRSRAELGARMAEGQRTADAET